MTIVKAIIQILEGLPEPLIVEQIYDRIVTQQLYQFKAVDPKAVVRSAVQVSPRSLVDRLPEEIIDDAYGEHLAQLRQALKERILANHPAFFERLVIDLLIKMGYGGSDPSLGVHTGAPDDGGIDGVIKEDQLGLDKIYIQAKRWALERDVNRSEVQGFAGAMNRVKKGVFITTARFNQRAIDFVEQHEKTISLIDGDTLCDLMILHGVGVSEVKMVRLLKVDGDYFSIEEQQRLEIEVSHNQKIEWPG